MSNCDAPIVGTLGLFSQDTVPTDIMALSMIASLQCWPKQCEQPSPPTESTWPATLTCTDTAPSETPPVGFDYPFDISIVDETKFTPTIGWSSVTAESNSPSQPKPQIMTTSFYIHPSTTLQRPGGFCDPGVNGGTPCPTTTATA